ncbi:GNAT family N-acetyltransferase [Nocardia sp. NPDC051750]|uniref:GNAT family N-acetyltransferase n=1 Tax=Nocardia sp. NPDC051750 TaxID=3364325 RepID=UPI0037BC34B1
MTRRPADRPQFIDGAPLTAPGEGRLRSARLEDLPILSEMEKAQFADLAYPFFILRQLFELHRSHWVVAEKRGEILGYAVVGVDGRGCAWVLTMTVSERARRNGIGTRLLEHVFDRCRDAQIYRVRLTVRQENTAAVKLYEKTGFRQIEHDLNYFGTDEPRDVLELRFDPAPRRWENSAPDGHRWVKHPRGPQL